jgi:hypothetical protein
MEKKKYAKPSMKVYEMEMSKIICQSGGGFNYIPTIPGQPDDEKQLA